MRLLFLIWLLGLTIWNTSVDAASMDTASLQEHFGFTRVPLPASALIPQLSPGILEQTTLKDTRVKIMVGGSLLELLLTLETNKPSPIPPDMDMKSSRSCQKITSAAELPELQPSLWESWRGLAPPTLKLPNLRDILTALGSRTVPPWGPGMLKPGYGYYVPKYNYDFVTGRDGISVSESGGWDCSEGQIHTKLYIDFKDLAS